MAIIPYYVDVPMQQRPWANYTIIALNVLFFLMQPSNLSVESDFLLGNGFLGFFTHSWMHADFFHLLGNMVFLWVFGNAVCAKVGQGPYTGLYLLGGFGAALLHVLFDDHPALGASGAVNGVVGMFLILYPDNKVSCLFLWFRGWVFSISSFWAILYWLAWDLYGVISGGGGVAYLAHLGGFATGFGLVYLMSAKKWVVYEPYERSLLEMMGQQVARRPRRKEVYNKPKPTRRAHTPKHHLGSEKSRPSCIRVKCDYCDTALKAPLKWAGRKAKCKSCGQTLVLPDRVTA